ncbi:MAG: hypothetical protein PHE03_11330 [Bacteroidales bacterium]|nr:hypothetical protein [Bacteroidales bacterium]
MATKSILKNIDIRERRMGRALILALEKSEAKEGKEVELSRICREIKGEKIKDIFGNI